MADNFAGYYKAQRDEAKRQREVGELIKQRRLREARGEEFTEEEELAYREQIESRTFGAYQVTTLPKKPENYGRGPSKSTRVASHKFVPGQRTRVTVGMNEFIGKEQINTGTVYVKFARPSKQQNGDATYKYSNVPVAIYESFRGANSKGRFINNPLDAYSPTKVDPDSEEYGRYCSDL
jgi:hypothetical protein